MSTPNERAAAAETADEGANDGLDAMRRRYLRTDASAPRANDSRPSRLFRFLGLSLSKAIADEIPIQSAALAFITLLALVPLLAGLSYFSAGFFSDRQSELVQLLAQVLPYTEQIITDSLAEFLAQSRQLRGLAFFAFLIAALSAFIAIDTIINDIWNVTARRSFRSRLSSFVQLLLFGPILIVGTYSFVFYLGQQATYQYLQESLSLHKAVQVLPTVVTALGLTVLYWQVPNTRVRFRNALAGGVTAALLIEGLRYGFKLYVEVSQRISAVYGSFGLVLLFFVSVQLTWAIVLLGTEVAYCTQNFSYMARKRRNSAILEGSWLGLATLVLVLERFRNKQPITPHEQLAEQLSLSVAELRRGIQPLVDGELLRESLGEDNGYMLSCDPYQVRLDEVLDLYEAPQWQLLEALPEDSARHLEALRCRVAERRTQMVADLTLTDMMAAGEGAGANRTETSDADDRDPGELDPSDDA